MFCSLMQAVSLECGPSAWGLAEGGNEIFSLLDYFKSLLSGLHTTSLSNCPFLNPQLLSYLLLLFKEFPQQIYKERKSHENQKAEKRFLKSK